MSTWQIFSDARNNFRWEMSDQQLQKEEQCDAVPQQHTNTGRLPSMADLLLLGCSKLVENGMANSENSPLFRTALGKSVDVKQSSIAKAHSVLGAIDDTGNLSHRENEYASLKPTSGIDSLKPAVLMKSGPQSASGDVVNMSNSMFQTASGKKVNLSSAGLLRAKTLLALDESYDQESMNGFGQQQKQSTSTDRLAWDNPSHLETQGPGNLNISSSASGNVVNMSNSMFQTASGKKVNLSAAGLLRAKTLLDEKDEQESTNGFEQKQKQSTSSDRPAWDNPLHLETSNLNISSSTKILSSSIKSGFCKSEPIKFSDFMNAAANPSPVKFLTSGGRSISVSNDALQRAKSLLGNPACDSFLNEASTAGVEGKLSCASNPNNYSSTPLFSKQTDISDSSSMVFTSPPRSHSYRKQSFGKLEKLHQGNNLITQFDAEAEVKSSNRPYNALISDRKPLRENLYSDKMDVENASQPKVDPSRRPFNGALVDISNTMNTDCMVSKQYLGEKKRLRRFSSALPFKKPRSSFVTPLKKNNSSATKDLSRIASKEVCFKQRVSTRYPIQVSRAYLKEYLLQPPSLQKELKNLPEYVRRMNPVAAESYTFRNKIPSDCIGPETFYLMLSQSGASIQYLTKEWVANHYKWIVWKLASYERCYPAKFAGKLLTVSNVVEELRYRYEREVNHGHRSSIKKILDGDVAPSSMMVLCISSVVENLDPDLRNQSVSLDGKDRASRIELTDGWYSVKALLDEPLSRKLASGKLFLGQKLRICGAKLNGWVGPISPFEASQETSLFLHMNGTYRCHWADRLGLCNRAGDPLAFRCIKATGGAVPSTLVGVMRIYPLLYKERLKNGSFIVRSERVEATALQLYNQRIDVVAEGIISAFQRETEFDVGDDHESEEGAKLMKLLETAAEPEVLMAGMSSKQLICFASYKTKLEATRQSEMKISIEKALEAAGLKERDVTPFLRVKVVGLANKCDSLHCGPRQGLITLWSPTQKQILELCEGQAYIVDGLVPSRSDSGILYLQARGSSSNWLPLSPPIMEKFEPFFTARSSTSLSSLGKVPLSSEFDIAAFVVYVGEVYRQGHLQKQWVFVTDGSTNEFCSSDAILAINFCSPCVEFDSCTPVNSNISGSVVGFVNLTKRPRDQVNGIWVAEATENSDYFLNYDTAGRNHLKNAAASVLKWAKSSSKIVEKLKQSVLSVIRNSNGGC
ncbi:hypothetical protein CASFOL_000665 [Castilleja foliolosa]|uniref:Tower domain-containing protein n=1 Tax=Castilleja foliolosa TaxID=1961234 RepID=A0ABD3ENT4_9LAMI